MSGEPQVLSTVEKIDAEIERLNKARDEYQRVIEDPAQRESRRIRREQFAGRWLVTFLLEKSHLDSIRREAGEEAWLFDPDLLQSDGWVKHDDGRWTLPSQAPKAGAGP